MIFVVNPGSSSIKFRLYSNPNNKQVQICEGIAERIGIDGSITIKYDGKKITNNFDLKNHEIAAKIIFEQLQKNQIINNIKDIKGVGFRLVHGADKISKACVIDEEIIQILKNAIKLAPLHNPPAITSIEAFRKQLPSIKFVGCFDTAYHQTLSKKNFLYSTPIEWYEKNSLRKYGFHGISYEYIANKMSEILKKDVNQLNLIVLHLGNGASACAIRNGKSIDTTMGLTPLAGLVMGTRSGDIDPSIHLYMSKQLNKSIDDITDILNKHSGILGLSKISSDMRDVIAADKKGDNYAKLALEIYDQKVADYLVQFANKLEGKIDAIVFTAGVGENDERARQGIVDCSKLLCLELDSKANQDRSYEEYLQISTSKSKYKVYKVRTNEELMICKNTLKLI